jgi:hypothetical protein
MVFTVQAKSCRPGEGCVVTDTTNRKDAVDMAVGLLGQSMTDVVILDEDGLVYQPEGFARFLAKGAPGTPGS